MTKEQMEVVRLHMRDTYDLAPWEWDSVELELAIYELITKSQAKNNKVLDLVSKSFYCADVLGKCNKQCEDCKDIEKD